MTIRADLHNHSCLSPCGDLYASPRAVAKTAASRGIQLMALTDHNSAQNCPAFRDACERFGIVPLFGLEVTSREEVHLLSLFEELGDALEFDRWVYDLLPEIPNDPERFGDQVVVNVDEEILREVQTFLLPGIEASIEEIEAEVHRRGGLFIPAHVDRSAYSMVSQLGFIPEGNYDAVEITRWPPLTGAERYSLICDSDAHYLEDIGRRTFTFEAADPSFRGLLEALRTGATRLSIE
ncbi:MAG: PHP domain-containing protein [Alkalispirochaetaceae bacterium]